MGMSVGMSAAGSVVGSARAVVMVDLVLHFVKIPGVSASFVCICLANEAHVAEDYFVAPFYATP